MKQIVWRYTRVKEEGLLAVRLWDHGDPNPVGRLDDRVGLESLDPLICFSAGTGSYIPGFPHPQVPRGGRIIGLYHWFPH